MKAVDILWDIDIDDDDATLETIELPSEVEIPDNIDDLIKLPGIGRKTANLIVGEIFKKPAIICDTHCIRITNLLKLSSSKNPVQVEKQLKKILPPDK